MLKIKDYKILYGVDSAGGHLLLQAEVKKAIKDGWQPYGQPYLLSQPTPALNIHYQAMVKYED
jgi:hypothetical protein